MTPKEKARELFDKFYIVYQEYTEEIQCSIQAKECAIIAVNEILNNGNLEYMKVEVKLNTELYWFEVKREITKL